jgi:DNA-binding LytR/AlgR family response regulator
VPRAQQAGPPPLRALVVDDEAPAREELAWLLGRDPRIGRVRAAAGAPEALLALESEPVDVVFCDVKMPQLNGLDLARVLSRFAQRPHVVFVTAYDEHATDAFDLRATDYVRKPVRPERLAEAVRRVIAAVEPVTPGASSVSEAEPEDETIPVELGGVTRFINRSQIRYAQAQGDYARLHTGTGSHLVRIPLSTLEERWAAAGFVRIHRSTLVALQHVREVRMEHGRCSVVLDGVELQVSRRHTRDLRDRLLRTTPRPGP